jgi:SAM-dependent methyltransferase
VSHAAVPRDRCEVCLGESAVPRFTKRGYDFVECRTCGHLRVRFDGSDEDLRLAYERFFTDSAYLDYVADRAAASRNFARFITVLRRFQPGGRLFEIGAAYGFFLDLARAHWQVRGIDLNAEAAAYARAELGLDVTAGEFLDSPVETGAYDAVVMWDTIEHLRAPRAYVEKTAAMLKPGGLLAVTTGDVSALLPRVRGTKWRLCDPPFHLQYFSRATLTRLFEECGFEVVRVQSTGYYRSLGFMLHRIFVYEKRPIWRHVYRLAQVTGLTQRMLYLNVFDIMMVVARKKGA